MGAGTGILPLSRRAGRQRGDAGCPTAAVWTDDGTHRRLTSAQIAATVVGALDVFLLLWLVLPSPESGIERGTLFLVNGLVGIAFLAASGAIGWRLSARDYAPISAWLSAGRPPTAAERACVLGVPRRCAAIDAVGWTSGAALFFALNAVIASPELAAHIAVTILLGGLTCTALAYLLCERLMRPVTALALAHEPDLVARGPGVAGRLVLVWACATGMPLLGLMILGIEMLVDPSAASTERFGVSVLALAVAAVGAGLMGTLLVARSVADPLRGVRAALARIRAGELEARVTVDDGSEVGLVQSGVNAMAAGLEERERLRDLFGRHVGEEVARSALASDDAPRLGGEQREVAVLFVDLIGSTSLAARRPPDQVVALLNRFFAVVVDVVERHGGWVNKFEGDAALAVFGAPADHEDAAGAVLRAARELRHRLHVLPHVDAGIGVSAGPAVAGNVGAERRFEYTVIGDPVNEAARLCDLAKRRDARLLVSAAVVERAGHADERARWASCDEVVLRGRRRATLVAAPV